MATYIGTIFNDTNYGNEQTQYGIDGNDFLSPQADNKPYFLYGGEGVDQLFGFNYSDELYGGQNRDYLYGYGDDDYIEGGSGNDFLYGMLGDDLLSGGKGRDVFVFDTKLNKKTNVDTISDYDTSKDLIDLDSAIFSKAGPSGETLKAKKFVIGNKAKDKSDRIIYNDKNGVIKYDPDGTGSKSATKFAIVDAGLDMTHVDFFVI